MALFTKNYILGIVLVVCSLALNLNASCLISQYNFSGNANDSKGSNHGTVNGAFLVYDRFGNPNSAYGFSSSSNSYIKIPHLPFFRPNYSYSVWVKPSNLPSNGNAYIFLSIGGVGGDQNMQIENNQNNYTLGYLTGFTLTAYNINGNIRAGVASGTLPTVNNWYHVVCTRDSNYFKVYVNGCLKSVSPSTNGSLPSYGNSAQAATIGCRSNLSKFFNGALDDIGIYSCALNANEVSKLYNSSKVFAASKDTISCADSLKNYKMKATSGWCSYTWVDVKNPTVVLSNDSFLELSIYKSSRFKVTNNVGDSAFVNIVLSQFNKQILPKDTLICGNAVSFILNTKFQFVDYLWNNGSKGNSLAINAFGSYSIRVKDSSGCSAKDTFNVVQKVPPKVNIGNDTTICMGDFFQLTNQYKKGLYQWSDGSIDSVLNIKNSGIYRLKFQDTNGCIGYDTIQIKVRPHAKAGFSVNSNQLPVYNPVLKITNKASGYKSLKYTFSDGFTTDSTAPYHRFSSIGKYKIVQVAIDSFGCNDTFDIGVECYEDYFVLIPDAFSPNDDGVNEIFKPYLRGVSDLDFELIIYDRWGGIVFISQSPNQGWDGKIKGVVVPDTVFLYTLRLRTTLKQLKIYSGTFTVLH